jgi:hypothetical protein
MTFHRFLAFVAFVSVIGRRSWIIFVDLDSMRQAAVDDLVVNTLWWETDVATTSATILPVPTLHCIQRTVHFIGQYYRLFHSMVLQVSNRDFADSPRPSCELVAAVDSLKWLLRCHEPALRCIPKHNRQKLLICKNYGG